MDLILPRLNGWSAGEWIKLDPETRHIPVVALTVRTAEVDQEKARAAGADSYLTKPCEPSRIHEEVQRPIGSPEAGANS